MMTQRGRAVYMLSICASTPGMTLGPLLWILNSSQRRGGGWPGTWDPAYEIAIRAFVDLAHRRKGPLVELYAEAAAELAPVKRFTPHLRGHLISRQGEV